MGCPIFKGSYSEAIEDSSSAKKKMILLGLDGSGKSSILEFLKTSTHTNISSTVGVNIETLVIDTNDLITGCQWSITRGRRVVKDLNDVQAWTERSSAADTDADQIGIVLLERAIATGDGHAPWYEKTTRGQYLSNKTGIDHKPTYRVSSSNS